MRNIHYLILIVSFLIVTSCKKSESDNTGGLYVKDKISGYIQKGPYINGTSIMISELSSTLTPTGKVFNSQIIDNKGSFELKNITLSSNFVELIANGFYFNENTGKVSTSQLTLHALSDLTDSSTMNVNILTELEKGRVEYLISKGSGFKSSKIQAQKEILKVFEISKPDLKSSEYLDISKGGEDNAILLAISIVMQGLRTEAELSELIAGFSSDIKEDGILNNQQIGQKLISDVKLLNISTVKNNIISRYSDLGVTIEIPGFEKYIKQFEDSTKFIPATGIDYADNGSYGPNILSLNRFDYPATTSISNCSLTAKLAKGTSLKVLFYPDFIQDTSNVSDTTNVSNPGHYSSYGVAFYDNSGWRYNNDSYPIDGSMILYNGESDRTIEAKFYLDNHGSAKLEIFENNQLTPARIKKIKW
jgi:hypothetical protein